MMTAAPDRTPDPTAERAADRTAAAAADGTADGAAEWSVAALYRFTPFEDPAALRGPLRARLAALGARGTVLLAREGVNGTIAARGADAEAALDAIRALPGCAGIEVKRSAASAPPFRALKVRVKREIVTLGVPQADPTRAVGTYVAPGDWNAVVAAPDVVVIDARNDYETAIGRFEGAVDPGVRSFREFPDWWRANRARFDGRRIAMYCTGGIRCEKASSFLLSEGTPEVLHLEGGILRYLEATPPSRSLWRGACFVFDERVSVGHGLTVGPHTLCRACRRPVSPEDRASPLYREGVGCPACQDRFDDADRARFAERQRQMELAERRGARHLGAGPRR